MSSRTLYRWSGLALLFGGLLTLVCFTILYGIVSTNWSDKTTSFQTPGPTSPAWLLLNLMVVIGSTLIVLGLPGVYAHQAKRAGWQGLAGLVLTVFAILMTGVFGTALNIFGIKFVGMDATALVSSAGIPALNLLFIGVCLVFSLGTILLGWATIRAGMLPAAAGVAILVAGLVTIVRFIPLPDALWQLYFFGGFLEVISFFVGLAGF